ncbi:60S ribosomal protein L12 [Castilleja foliolosa]|uniref:60S ribosomal protein L12 n=1 Tax=Castilleja foliolosa TaxID=1961234 RepID=A0ABD3BMD5_9LAMI
MAMELTGNVNGMLKTCVSVGFTLDEKDSKDLQQGIQMEIQRFNKGWRS